MLLLLSLLLCAETLAIDPPAVQWVKGYTFGQDESHPHAGVETLDGGFFVVGDGVNYNNNTVNRTIMALRTDSTGKQLWQTTIGNTGYNYGKYGIQLKHNPGMLVLAGALSVYNHTLDCIVLHRALFLLDDKDGSVQDTTFLANTGAREHKRDGYMSVVERNDGSIIAVGFVNGENSTKGYVDEPMFLIGGGSVSVTKFTLNNDTGFSVEQDIVITGTEDFDTPQAMRVLNYGQENIAISHTTSLNHDGNFEFGLTLMEASSLKILWTRSFPAANIDNAHASHPYALTVGTNGTINIGGLAVIYDRNHIEQCQGRLVSISNSGTLQWDKRFTSVLPDTNIECYGLQTTYDGGYIMTCGTGVEPELHPKDSPKSKTWRVLLHRTDRDGVQLWQKTYTSNDQLQNNAGEYIVACRDGSYAVYIDSQSWGSPTTGGNFAIGKLDKD
eukprot:m.345133 g.345133  ORF g.345133 m.345133 type:complete len:443 (+) comp25774_c0_seq1:127-1455(+)